MENKLSISETPKTVTPLAFENEDVLAITEVGDVAVKITETNHAPNDSGKDPEKENDKEDDALVGNLKKKIKELEHKINMNNKLAEQADKMAKKKNGGADAMMKQKMQALEKNILRVDTEKKQHEELLAEQKKELVKNRQELQSLKMKNEHLEKEVAKFKKAA
jgi:chromosome segregation ATPase